MKISGSIRYAVMIVVLIDVVRISAAPQDRLQLDPQVFDPFVVDVKAKRPFCNAFTGCGRKRSSGVIGQNMSPSVYGEGNMKSVRLPFPLYRALLRAAAAAAAATTATGGLSQEMNNQIMDNRQEQSFGNDYNRIQEIPLQEFDILSSQKLQQQQQQQQQQQPRDQYES